METISQLSLTKAILRLSHDMVLEPGKDCSVFDVPVPTFDFRATSALAGQTHGEKIFSLCSLDRLHTTTEQWREPDPICTTRKTNPVSATAAAARTGFGLWDCVWCDCVCVCFYLTL